MSTTTSDPEAVSFDRSSHSHRRFNPLTRTWVLCSPHRTKRPWQGAVEPPQLDSRPAYDPKCYLCPGNERAGGVRTEKYEGTFIFENDFAALVEDSVLPPPPIPEADESVKSLFRQESARGKCHVICFSPRHDLTVAEMKDQEIEGVIEAWTKLYKHVSKEYPWIKYIQIFENKGSMMGCSNPHPHGQSWSLSYIPTIPSQILESQLAFASSPTPSNSLAPLSQNGTPNLLLTYVTQELAFYAENPEESRVIFKGDDFVALVPFWAGWPFEAMILPYKRQIASLSHLTPSEISDLATSIGHLTRRFDNLFSTSFAYSMGVYQTPTDNSTNSSAYLSTTQLHLLFLPPLLRSASVRKFLVGFELMAETQRDITPEQAAARLRGVEGETHYKLM
ncbi:galactose-1-phosphate uridylyltransferase [Microbotryum lychnidis-dioicae p1A1 Lamole]|uniref:Galactose-1-phosphate uridylyltransferase n=1 Tax=Microbotryum lychnidis-dioicae (strain p1A1 Lamole / MvSl-1064) TaxID=683840 RepID=U5H5K6_USTV1|nr:galactose-1-phosphate uridylyltransferase [Microbotryum lychnidis-dioicae p1A1 Lamole]|eukprot:KDE07174.1 galactose-1-phosphate uridylyltransferase [Microbotryum lychnidis-dioicae p1A1 Lamole]